MPVEEEQFQTLLEQVRELHRLADELTRSARLNEHVRARLSWDPHPPTLPAEQMKLADDVIEVLETKQLSSAQARQLQKAFFGRWMRT